MHLSEKQNTVPEFFSAVSKYSLNFEHSEKIDHRHSLFISEVTTSKICG